MQKCEVFVKMAFKKITAVYLWQKSTLFIVFDEFKNLYFTFNRILNNIIYDSPWIIIYCFINFVVANIHSVEPLIFLSNSNSDLLK